MKRFFALSVYILSSNLLFSQQVVTSVLPNAVTVLPANNAVLSDELRPTQHQDLDKDPKVFAIQGWKNKEQTFTWNVKAGERAAYKVAMLIQIKSLSSNGMVTLQLSSDLGKIELSSSNSEWDKIFFSGSLLLDNGVNKIKLKLSAIPEGELPDISLYSIEIATDKIWKKNRAEAESLRSKPKWLTEAKYGLFFHWNARSKPRNGEGKTYINAVKDFDVTKFASMIHETGADFIILTTSWALSTFPAPLKSLDNLIPGNTTPRDLIADLSDALAKKNIKLLVYCNFRINRIGWKKEDLLVPAKTDSALEKVTGIYKEIIHRYANKIGGLWIDDGMGLYPYNAPFESLKRTMKQADRDMVVGYNSWIYPRFTDFQDFYGGEHGITLEAAGVDDKYLPVGGAGYFTGGAQKGLKATFCGLLEPGDWTHTETDQEIPPPILKPDELTEIVRQALLRKNVPVMNVRVYQDGTISPETFSLLTQLKNNIIGNH